MFGRSSLVVALGIVGNVFGYRLLDPVAALIVGLMVTRMGWHFGWEALHDLMDRAVDQETVEAIHQTMLETPGRATTRANSLREASTRATLLLRMLLVPLIISPTIVSHRQPR